MLLKSLLVLAALSVSLNTSATSGILKLRDAFDQFAIAINGEWDSKDLGSFQQKLEALKISLTASGVETKEIMEYAQGLIKDQLLAGTLLSTLQKLDPTKLSELESIKLAFDSLAARGAWMSYAPTTQLYYSIGVMAAALMAAQAPHGESITASP